MGRSERPKEETAEDYCFVCKDGGKLLICEYGDCLKAYHPQCVGKDESFLETGECWTCGWHKCFICHKSSEFQCFCCPNSVCGACIGSTEFVQVRKTKGFCTSCLKLLILAEENADMDSDGGKLDFRDIETNEFLFKDYWNIIKTKEKLSMKDLYEAEALLKKGKNYKSGYKSSLILEDEGELTSDAEDMNKNLDSHLPFPEDEVPRNRKTGSVKRFRFTKRDFRGWGSVELIEFLTFLGKDTTEPLKQWDVCEIIEKYIHEKNLLHTNRKKKTALCDDKLRSLFRKKTVRLVKIFNLLEGHFAANVDSDDSEFGSEEGSEPATQKKLRWTNSETEGMNRGEKVHEPPKSCYASMIEKNIKLVYLRRSLLKEFLKNPETFERKVVGCFVRVKSDPKDFDFSPNKLFVLRQVSGIKRVPEAYMVGEMSTGIVLHVSNIWKDIRISMLSDDDFEEEECEELCQLVKKGLLRRPTVVELEEKVRSIHEDIMTHWIKREIIILQRQIDRANEKGWIREKCECIERRALLQSESEQARLLKEIPKVIPDTEDLVDMTNPRTNSQRENKDKKSCPSEEAVEAKAEGFRSIPSVEAVEAKAEGFRSLPSEEVAKSEGFHSLPSKEAVEAKADGKKSGPSEESVEAKAEGNETTFTKKAVDDEGPLKSTDMKQISYRDIGVIVIDDDDDDEPPEAMAKTLQVSCDLEKKPKIFGESEQVWYYLDPSGKQQGPFPMSSLRYWRSEGYFDDAFRVWSIGQSQTDAILLKEALLTNIDMKIGHSDSFSKTIVL